MKGKKIEFKQAESTKELATIRSLAKEIWPPVYSPILSEEQLDYMMEMMYSMQEKERPERITILEIYADRAAYERHIRTPHFRTYKQRSLEMVRKLELLDQNPLVPEMKMK